jgi:UDP-glucose 4-epimerase
MSIKALVIGSKGFIGSHLIAYLSAQGAEVWGCDVFTDYNEVHFFLVDASNADYNEMFVYQRFDVCINCSGAANVSDSLVHPLRDFTLNTFNVVKLLEAIRKHAPACRFLNISSAAVYGNPAQLPVAETQRLLPVSPYGLHKLQAEQLCGEYTHHFKVQTCSVRVFSAYGIGLRKQLLWDLFIKSRQHKKVSLFGTGKESRDFIHVDDIAKALWLIIQNGDFAGDVYNVANGIEVPIEKLVSVFYNVLGEDIAYTFNGEKRKGDPQNWVADISRLKALGYETTVKLEQGVQQYIQWLREEK